MDEVVVSEVRVVLALLDRQVCTFSFPRHRLPDGVFSAAAEDGAAGEVRIVAGWELVSVPSGACPVQQGLSEDVDVLRRRTSRGVLFAVLQVGNDFAGVSEASAYKEPPGGRYWYQVCLFCLPSNHMIEGIVFVDGRSAELCDPVAVIDGLSDKQVADVSAR